LELTPNEAKGGKVKRLPPLLRKVRSRLRGLTLIVSFTLTRRAKVQLLAKRGGQIIARTPRRILSPGRRELTMRLSRERYPTGLAFKTKEIKEK
jgi:hypothetical protein